MLYRTAISFTALLAMLFWTSPRLSAQTTRPSDTPSVCEHAVDVLADSLTSGAICSGDASDSSEALSTRVAVARFGSPPIPATEKSLTELTLGARVIASHAYEWPATSVASDLADDFKRAVSLPDAVREQFVPHDDSSLRKADSIALKWLSSLLGTPGDGEWIGLIVLWREADDSSKNLPMFLVVRCKPSTGSDPHEPTKIAITSILFGDADQALN